VPDMCHGKQWLEPGPFGIGQVSGIGVCVFIPAAYLTPPFPFFPQFPNGLDKHAYQGDTGPER
jgi:hypothetical protein